MGACPKLPLFVLSMLAWLLLEWTSLSSGAEDVFEMHPKYGEESQVTMDVASSLVERDTQRIGRRLQALSKSTLFPMQGTVYPEGIYYITLVVGNPPQQYFMDVDTGSDLTWLQCDAPCRKCAQGPHQLYKPRQFLSCKDPLCAAVQASSHQRYDCKSPRQQCDYDIRYADRGSSLGVLARDDVLLQLANRTLAKFSSVLGCGYDQDGSLAMSPARTDGVLGLGTGTASLPSQWSNQGLIKNVIGLCIAGGGKKGYMFFGDEYVPPSGMTWVPMLGKPAMKHYYAGAAQMIFGKKLLVRDGDEKRLGGIIFDSGSSYTYFVNQAYAAVLSAVHESIGKYLVKDSTDRTLPICWRGKKKFSSVADVKSYFKPLLLNFRSTSPYSKSAKLEIPPEGYLIISRGGNVCLGILNGTGVADYNILGDISLQSYLLVLDNGNNRIGWVRADCTKVSNHLPNQLELKSSETQNKINEL